MAKVSVTSVITPVDAAPQTISGRYDAHMLAAGLEYFEPETNTTVEIYWSESELHITRTGESRLNMHLIAGQSMPALMVMQEGELEFTTVCESVRHKTRTGGGLIQVKYELHSAREHISDHKLTIGYYL